MSPIKEFHSCVASLQYWLPSPSVWEC
ncbi:MAG TPA: hypothetical protein DCR52_00275 [Actinobacteria bacterium]|nr:hypothetical protein [Actinomycetota bacterium]